MSLDTVLKIGETFRKSENNLKYFKYIEACPKDIKGEWPLCVTIPLNGDFTFNLDSAKITPENERDNLYYLKYKTSDSDSSVRYIFGDIYYEKKSKIKKNGSVDSSEGGYYKLDGSSSVSSFYRGSKDYKELISPVSKINTLNIEKFHNEFVNNVTFIERMLRFIPAIYYFFDEGSKFSFKELLNDEKILHDLSVQYNFQTASKQNLGKMGIATDCLCLNETQKESIFLLGNLSIFIHFEFPGKKYWYQYKEDVEAIKTKLLSEFVDTTDRGVVLKKSLYKTLCSGDKKNDIQFPGFLVSNKHKSKQFRNDTLQDLFYALDYVKKGGTSIQGTDIELIVLPRGDHLRTIDYEEFCKKRNETKISAQNNENDPKFEDSLFDFLSDDEKNVTSFDLIFCKKGGSPSSPDKDLIELSGIEKSQLRRIKERIEKISDAIYEDKKKFFGAGNKIKRNNIAISFQNILGYPQISSSTGKILIKANPKYKSHLLKVIPLIYTDNYYQDERLLPSFIQNIEYSIRAGDNKFNVLKFDLMFLLKIQNSQKFKGGGFMEIKTSESYEIGLLLGELSKNLRQDINSFDKKYVGNLTRRIATMEDFIKFKNEIEQKLIMHDKTNFTYKISYDLSQKVKEFNSVYNKDKCVFGFMESYFKPWPKKKENSQMEDNESNQ
jgi:hypothetical protein